jgi:hypothetical protein
MVSLREREKRRGREDKGANVLFRIYLMQLNAATFQRYKEMLHLVLI